MLVTYKNRRGKTYYLHEGRTKTGKPKYHFSLKNNGELVDEIPDGYEIYEHPGTGGVFLRKKLPQLILNIEKDVIEKELKKKEGSRRYLFDTKGKVITIWESNQDIGALMYFFHDTDCKLCENAGMPRPLAGELYGFSCMNSYLFALNIAS